MALAYKMNAQLAEATKSIEKALSLLDPPSALYFVRAGQIYEASGDTIRALENYKNALAVDPGNNSAQTGINRISAP